MTFAEPLLPSMGGIQYSLGMRILFVGGGSIGHVAPCVAVWRALEKLSPHAQAHFVCSNRPEEADFLRKEGLEWTALGERNQSWRHPLRLLRAYNKAAALLDTWKPDAVFSKGGSLSIPVAYAARRREIPIVLHESDAVMGKANRMIARWASVVCTGFPPSPSPLPQRGRGWGRGEVCTGNPVRPDITQGSRTEGLRITGFSGNRPVLLVLGGSQGAQAINDVVGALLPDLLKTVDVAHLTGRGKGKETRMAGYWHREFAHEELPHLYAIADLALSRSGGGAISELAESGIPAILVPLRGVAHDHQQANAQAAARGGGCIVMQQEHLHGSLLAAVHELAGDQARRATMSAHMRSMVKVDAAKGIARELLKMRGTDNV